MQVFPTYNNQLKNVSDAVSSSNSMGFVDGNTNPGMDDYEYDVNDFRVKDFEKVFCEESERSSMVKDRNKGIKTITYNHLNLPVRIEWSAKDFITYQYNAAGQKVQKRVVANDSVKVVDYLDGFQYAGKVLQFFPHAEGYVKATSMNRQNTNYAYNYVFNYTDHLGNVRLSYSKDPQTGVLEILDENHYYPFGLKHEVYVSADKKEFDLLIGGGIDGGIGEVALKEVLKTEYLYKYNGKEFQDELNLSWYDYHARNYDPAIGRWMNPDPLAEMFMDASPYNYALNNPIFFIDPDGMEAQVSVDTDQLEETDRLVNIGYDRVVSANSFGGSFSGSYTSIFESNEGNNQNSNGDPNKIREQIVENANSKEGNTSYAFNKKKDNFDDTSDKCNKFVYDILKDSGADPGTPNGHILNRMIGNGSPPTAGQWADPNYHIPGWEVTKTPKPGDVVAAAHNYSNGATGHVAIMVSNTQSIGANATVVRITDFGSNPSHLHSGSKYVYRTYVGNSSSNYSNVNPAYKQYP